MEHEKYIVISSKHSKDYFPNNRPSHFRVCLEHYIDFEHPYECALMDFTCSTTKFENPAKSVFIYFNMTSEQPIGGITDSLVRHTTVRCGHLEMEKFILPYYIPVKPIKTNILEMYIKDENGKEVSFLKKATTCTFHFRKKLWLID